MSQPNNDSLVSASADDLLIDALRRGGPQTIESLSSESGLSWGQVFLAIDRLSRTGAVSLRRLPSKQYQVSAKEVAA
jgi:DNA-binding GntR family transcriptional regulator